jgi:replicative superfamily II helicase
MNMKIQAFVKSRNKDRIGKGFSRNELKEVCLSFSEALKIDIPIDSRRSTIYEKNIQSLRGYVKEFKSKLAVKVKEKYIEIKEVKGVGPKTIEKLRNVGIETANNLAVSNPKIIMDSTGFSKKKASKIIQNAKALLKEKS